MLISLAFAALALLYSVHYIWRNVRPQTLNTKLNSFSIVDVEHEVYSAFIRLINEDGAGEWPPKANHDQWPAPLRPYKNVYAAISPLLANADPSTDDEWNQRLCSEFRSRMRSLLADIDVTAVENVLRAVEDGDWNTLRRDSYNGFYSCIGCLRHAYR